MKKNKIDLFTYSFLLRQKNIIMHYLKMNNPAKKSNMAGGAREISKIARFPLFLTCYKPFYVVKK